MFSLLRGLNGSPASVGCLWHTLNQLILSFEKTYDIFSLPFLFLSCAIVAIYRGMYLTRKSNRT